MKLPTEPGLYWAALSGYKWYNCIVDVAGEAPMLYVASVFDLGMHGPRVCKLGPGDLNWGPKLERPTMEATK